MHRLTVDVAATDTARRMIEGTAVPYNETADLGFFKVRFAPGSIHRARNATPLLLGHDANQPVGVLSQLVDGEDGARIAARVDKTEDGDTALEQARSGSRSGLSIGFEIEESDTGEDGIVEVSQAALYEVSLCAIPAFAGASVDRVAAHRDPGPNGPIADDDDDDDDETGELPTDPEQEGTDMEPHEAAAPAILTAQRGERRELSAGEFVQLSIRAQHGEQEAGRLLTAALSETISTDVTGLLPPTYERSVIGAKSVPRILYGIFRSRPLPGVGLAVNKPKWTTPPDGAWAATVDDDAHSNKVVIGGQAANVERWDWAGAIPWVVVQRSDPSIVDEIYREAVEDFYFDVEAKIAAEVIAAALNAADTLGGGIAAFYEATNRVPEVMLVSPDVWGILADAGALSLPTAAGDVSTSGGLSSTFGGVPIVATGQLPAATRILATRRAVDARVTDPVRLTANAIGALNVELAVVGEGMFDTDYPGELMALTAPAPGGLEAQARQAKERGK